MRNNRTSNTQGGICCAVRPGRSPFQLSAFRFQPSSSAFTLVEMLVVVALIGILFGLITSAVLRARVGARRRQAQSDCYTLGGAVVAYHHQFGIWPIPDPDKTDLVTRSTDNHVIMDLILNNDLDKAFVNAGEYQFDSAGNVLTPWGTKYYFVINPADRATTFPRPHAAGDDLYQNKANYQIGPDTVKITYLGKAR